MFRDQSLGFKWTGNTTIYYKYILYNTTTTFYNTTIIYYHILSYTIYYYYIIVDYKILEYTKCNTTMVDLTSRDQTRS